MFSIFKSNKEQTSARQLKRYYKIVDQINNLEETYVNKSDAELREMTFIFKNQLEQGEPITSIIPDAFAVVREASKRVLGMRHFDVQLIGGLVLTEGNIAEMPTGEGKTLVASLPSYVRALEGKGVHVITVNDYLAKRDYELVGQIHRFLGLTVGLNVPMMEQDEKKLAYNADITYGVGTEFGFDYLRDNMAHSLADKVQRPYHFAIIDEVDSVLIDEAKTPLIIAGKMASNNELHQIAAMLAKRFKVEEDYDFDEETKATSLTDKGIEKVEAAFNIDNLYDLEHQTLFHYVIQAVRAHVMFKRDVDYIVKNDKIELVDMFTGRILEGRSLSDGLHQAIEAKEGVTITDENKSMAQITIQNYFRMYPRLSGMTGTAKTQEKEIREVYGMEVVQIPTNRPRQRVDQPDIIFSTQEAKYKYVAAETKKRHEKGQPILIGTTSILQSETVADYLKKEKLTFQLLNAKTVEQEVELISQAGQKGRITVATNMAGRGTDIVLGEEVHDLGGLYVMGTEKHESRRVDNQLRGRSGRQGDIGESRFILSIEDDMFRRYAKEEVEKFSAKMVTDENGIIQNKEVQELIDRTQRIVEGSQYGMREYNLKLDDVINDQRTVLYGLRDKILAGEDLMGELKKMLRETVDFAVRDAAPEDVSSIEWDYDRMEQTLNSLFITPVTIDREVGRIKQILADIEPSELELLNKIEKFSENEQILQAIPQVMLSYIDSGWVRHLEAMAHLKEGIGLRHYQQEDPMRIYQREGLELFGKNFQELRRSIIIEITSFMKTIEAQQEEQ
ncbi:MAG TPA: accessory Sec system translocase SecA2 [Lysinibacillus sp.]|jgi:preprotein translocase subunit SecA|uniref:Protein translocase subunit SecA n=1 Tax=Lysinibacillus fusiformis TaxID=28031 RepID=A0A2I0V5S7_9BACI|nr:MULTISPECIES: accessory Sec system translocase SecA2 [Lysinibacillus]HBT71035.1 accessory Sec system translocase SecA2 [Lysinibacillus sp.]KUF35325.1 preprotein translocase subunit SecA [Lysinibacillus sp. F5]MEE3807546.1 accessory Sec system translocase SecA2 [Lysinibacillus fusiformis]PKU53645.1 accessory Sec system translocase SecA2 [Lysinibacillus fusiformis]WCH48394.1 accessory Sec system translocase SecA2 [Lysinibacillus sp. OF-1]